MKSGTIELHLDAEAHTMLRLITRASGLSAREAVKYALSCAVFEVRNQLERLGVRPDHTDAARDEGGEAETTCDCPPAQAEAAKTAVNEAISKQGW